MICNVHWQSDVMMGRIMGAAAFARLHADPEFLAAIEASRDELKAARDTGVYSLREIVSPKLRH